MPSFCWVYVTCKNGSEARLLARMALQKRLAACANMFPVSSLFWWDGAIRGAREVAVVFKTRASLEKRLVQELEKAHSYSVPCIDSLPVAGVNSSCAGWLLAQTRAGRSRGARKG